MKKAINLYFDIVQNCAYKVHMAHMVHVMLYCLGESSGHSGLIPSNGVSIDSVSRPLCVSHRGPPHPPLAACHVLHGTVSHWDDEGRWGENWIHFNGNAQMQSTWTIMGIPLFPDFAAALHVRKDLLYSCNTMQHNTTTQRMRCLPAARCNAMFVQLDLDVVTN